MPGAMTEQHSMVCDHTNEFFGLLICHQGHGTDVAVAQDLGYRLRVISQHAAGWIPVHDLSDLHEPPLCPLFNFHLVDDLSFAGIRLGDPQSQVTLLFALNRSVQNDRSLINMDSDIVITETGLRLQALLNLLRRLVIG
jgi:hypothetical protein